MLYFYDIAHDNLISKIKKIYLRLPKSPIAQTHHLTPNPNSHFHSSENRTGSADLIG